MSASNPSGEPKQFGLVVWTTRHDPDPCKTVYEVIRMGRRMIPEHAGRLTHLTAGPGFCRHFLKHAPTLDRPLFQPDGLELVYHGLFSGLAVYEDALMEDSLGLLFAGIDNDYCCILRLDTVP